ncbi:hypothetical protein BU23DRAFT_324814 [Bimuria novae-zelandiae CBS 107.79]|uniref:Uncharacterized protein n=1 Tax=Bimuria novae-zelandiae CBS 107.79 TaxID=1447943 RepID=A0A6A5UP75_9PLEO|nr:hypothetical protein BU23DRAFT_324814 [Bimuria novae-zelandiae CBS 107.79]
MSLVTSSVYGPKNRFRWRACCKPLSQQPGTAVPSSSARRGLRPYRLLLRVVTSPSHTKSETFRVWEQRPDMVAQIALYVPIQLSSQPQPSTSSFQYPMMIHIDLPSTLTLRDVLLAPGISWSTRQLKQCRQNLRGTDSGTMILGCAHPGT